jgi:hypothetical protein
MLSWLYFIFYSSILFAQENTEPKLISSPSFNEPLDSNWEIVKGTYQPVNGNLLCTELPENKHVAVIWHKIPVQSGIIEVELMPTSATKTFIIGFDGKVPKGLSHVVRLTVKGDHISIAHDQQQPSFILNKTKTSIPLNQWTKIRLQWHEQKITATINDITISAEHPFLSTEKVRSWFAVGGQTSIRNLKIFQSP